LGILQQMLEAAKLTKKHMFIEEPSTGPRRQEESVQPTLTPLTLGHKTLQIETNTLDLSMGKLHEKINALGHLNIIISRIPMQQLQYLQAGLVKEIRNRGEEEQRELERIGDEWAQLQEKYDTTLQQKREVKGRVEEALKKKYVTEERFDIVVKEKDKVESMAKKTQATIQNLYTTILEVPLVVEATMEEQVQTIGEVIKGLQSLI